MTLTELKKALNDVEWKIEHALKLKDLEMILRLNRLRYELQDLMIQELTKQLNQKAS